MTKEIDVNSVEFMMEVEKFARNSLLWVGPQEEWIYSGIEIVKSLDEVIVHFTNLHGYDERRIRLGLWAIINNIGSNRD